MTIGEFRLLKVLEDVGGIDGMSVHVESLAAATHIDIDIVDGLLHGLLVRQLVRGQVPLNEDQRQAPYQLWKITGYGQACINA